jgi:hypothetical protein
MSVRMLCVVALTVAGFGLRVRGLHEGLYHDELITYAELHGRSFGGMLDAVAHGASPGAPVENTPPLHFVLAWLASKLGDPTETIRLPSVVLGTATVPVVYALGRRTAGTAAALVAAGFIAFSPFAIFYGTDARAYGTLMFFAALSALVLLIALERDRPAWWVAYGLAVAAVVYTHYTGAIVIATEVGWALWTRRELWRRLVLACAGAAVLFLPWLPYVNSSPAAYKQLAALLGINDAKAALQWLAGSPDVLPSDLPGVPALVLLGAGAAVGLAGAIAVRAAPWRSPGLLLVLLLALGTPLVLLVNDVLGDDLIAYPRNMSAALPFAGVLLGWLVTRPPPAVAAVAIAAVTVGIGIGAAKTLENRYQRPDSPAVAAAVDARLGEGGKVVYYGHGFDAFILGDLLDLDYAQPHGSQGAVPEEEGSLRRALERAGRRERSIPVVQFAHLSEAPPLSDWELVARRDYPGTEAIVLSTFVPLDAARYRGLTVGRGVVEGALDGAAEADGGLQLSGWALTRDSRPVDHVLAYVGTRLVAAGIPNLERPELADSRDLSDAEVGFAIEAPAMTAAERARVRVIGTDGRRASVLVRYCSDAVRDLLGC